MADTSGLLAREYEAVNAHLRANIGQFVNWFSFFLVFSFAALAVFVATGDRWAQPRLLRLEYAVPAAFLLRPRRGPHDPPTGRRDASPGSTAAPAVGPPRLAAGPG